MAVLNGGGAPLKLRTTSGKIRLQFLDSEIALHESLIREQVERLNKRLTEIGFDPNSFTPGASAGIPTLPGMGMPPPSETKTDWLESWLVNLEIAFRGGQSPRILTISRSGSSIFRSPRIRHSRNELACRAS